MKIFLIDGSALVYRSHFALHRSPLVNRHGEITNAAFGTANAVIRLFEDLGADRVICAFDVKGPTFRHERYAEYKANRPPMPEEIATQLPRVRELLEAMDVPVLEREGFEADDIIGTLARAGAEAGHDMWIYSGDKDFIPLVGPHVTLLRPGARASAPDELLDEAGVKKKLGIRPAQFRDVLALMGDKSDNVPGVPGIGEKTAIKLISTFESVDRLREKLPDKRVSPRHQKLIEDNAALLQLSRELVTIATDVPLDFDVESDGGRNPWTENFRELCKELDFTSLLKRFDLNAEPMSSASGEGYRVVATVEELESVLAGYDRETMWSLDTETTGLDPLRAELVGLSISVSEGEAIYVPVDVGGALAPVGDLFATAAPERLPWGAVRDVLKPSLEDPSIAKVGQNLKYDVLVLASHGLEVRGLAFDTMIASYLLAPERRSHGLDALVEDELGLKAVPYSALFEGLEHDDIRRVPLDRLGHYACEDADLTRRLYEVFLPRVEAEGLRRVMEDIEMPLLGVLAQMERRGVRLDLELLAALSREWTEEQERITAELYELAGEEFNLNSPKQLQVILFEKLGLKPLKKTSTGFSTDVSVLTALAEEHDLPRLLLDYRQLTKLLSTYVDALPRLVNPQTGCVHTSFNQTVAATGRLSSADPNLQNIPIRTAQGRRIREAFVPREKGWLLLAADYSQVELRLMAHFAQEPALIEAFANGEDIHARTAALVHGVELQDVDGDMRRAAKAINFGILYGMGARALGQQIGVKTKDAQGFIDGYFASLPKVRAWIDATIAAAETEGEVRTMFGRRRRLPELASKDPRQRSFGERIAVNTPIQGSAADLIKLAMVRLDERLRREKLRAHLLLQVHDELILEVHADDREPVERAVREQMEQVEELRVPLLVQSQYGANWAEAHA